MFCEQCGINNDDDAKFCASCGTAVVAAVSSPDGYEAPSGLYEGMTEGEKAAAQAKAEAEFINEENMSRQEAESKLETTQNQYDVVHNRIERYELDLKMAIATGNTGSVTRLKNDIAGLNTLRNDLESQIESLNEVINSEVQEHESKADEFQKKVDSSVIWLAIVIFGGPFSLLYLPFLLVAPLLLLAFIVLAVRAYIFRLKYFAELAYARGHTAESWKQTRAEIFAEVDAKHRDREALAKSIAEELRK